MNDEQATELLSVVHEIRGLMRLMAEPAIAERDRKLREDLKDIVGRSVLKQKAILLMDGTRTQVSIHQEIKMNKGNLSTLVKQLKDSKLLSGDGKQPKLAISIPSNFFENREGDER